MIPKLCQYLDDVETKLNNAFYLEEKDPLWGIGEKKRIVEINAMLMSFNRELKEAPSEELQGFAEVLKPHLRVAMIDKRGWCMTDFENKISDSHMQLSFAGFALILRVYYQKKCSFNASEYAASAGITDFAAFSSKVIQAANDWAIYHNPTITELLTLKYTCREQRRPKDDILNNATAVSLLKIMQEEGLLDSSYQWIVGHYKGVRINKTAKAYFAEKIGEIADIKNWDIAFRNLWNLKGKKTLSSSYSDSQTTDQKFQDKYDSLLKIFER